MSQLSQCDVPGVLLVLSKPKAPEYLQDFHNWYDTEHGPNRLKLGNEYFSNGFRYKSISSIETTWLAIYDMKRLSAAAEKTYTSIREHRSERERVVIRDKVNVMSRQFLQTVAETGTAPSEPAAMICVIFMEVLETDEVPTCTWYSRDGFGAFRRSGFERRSRLFRLVDGTRQQAGKSLLCAVHDLSESAKAETIDLHKKATRLLSQKPGLLSSKITFFAFHRAFSAADYVDPTSTHASTNDRAITQHTSHL